MDPSLRIDLLGPVRVRLGGVAVRLGAPRAQGLLAALALRANHVWSVEDLLDAVWGDALPSTGVKVVPPYIYRLRQVLPDGIVRRTGVGYCLELPDGALDLADFDHAAEAAQRHQAGGRFDEAIVAYGEALALFPGDALVGLPGDFAANQRLRLTERRDEVFAELIDLELTCRPRPGLVGRIAAAAAKHPYNERFAGQLLRGLVLDGRPAEAIAAYGRLRQLLATELGVEPGPSLHSIYQEVLRARQSSCPGPTPDEEPYPARTPDQLPYAGSVFVGRTDELEAIGVALRSGTDLAPPVVAIDGMAGVGKTALAVAAAHRAADRYPDGRLYLDLHGHTPGRDPLELKVALDRLLTSAGVPGRQVPADLDTAIALWRTTFAGRRLLVVLDNVSGAEAVVPLLPGDVGCAVLVTSRRRLVDLDLQLAIHLQPLPDSDGLALLDRVAGPDAVPGTTAERNELVRLCGHLPLAIRLAGARLRHRPGRTVAGLNRRLEATDHRLAELGTGELGVWSAFRLSYEHLAPDARYAFRTLGLIPGDDFDCYVLAALLDTTAVAAAAVADELVDANLVAEPRPGRYRLHDLLRDYAAELASGTPDPAAEDRLLDYYLQAVHHPLARTAGPSFADPGPPGGRPLPPLGTVDESLAWAEAEAHNLLPVVARAKERGQLELCRLIAFGAVRFLHQGGLVRQRDELGSLALAAARESGDAEAEVRALHLIGRFARTQHGARAGVVQLEEALAKLPAGTAPVLRGQILASLGQALATIDPRGRALPALRESAALARENGDRWLLLQALAYTGMALINADDDDAALEQLQAAVATHRGLGPTPLLADVLSGLAGIHVRAGRPDQALEAATGAHDLAVTLHNRFSIPFALARIGDVHQLRGDLQQAVSFHREALRAGLASGAMFVVWSMRTNLADSLLAAGAVAEAQAQFEQVLDEATRHDVPLYRVKSAEGLADCAAFRNHPEQEREHVQDALAQAELHGLPTAQTLRARLGSSSGGPVT